MSPKIHLFFSPGSCSLAPHILLREVGLPFTVTKISVTTGFPSEYLHINPKGRVPILQLDSDIITENPAIMTAISQLAPHNSLFGKGPLDEVRCYEWMNWLSGTLHGQGYGGLFRPGLFVKDENMYDAVREKARETICGCYETIEAKLEGRHFAVGDGFTAVDAYLLVFYRWGIENGFPMKEKYPSYTRVIEGICKREAVLETAAEEAIELFQ